MTKDEEKQKQIREKTKFDSASDTARAIGQASTPPTTSGTPPQQPAPAIKMSTNPTSSKPVHQSVSTKPSVKSDAPVKRSNLFIQAIPPFKGKSSNPLPGDGNTSAAVNRLNVSASSFKPNPQAIAFTPVCPFSYTSICTFAEILDYRAFPLLLRPVHRLPTNLQNQNLPSRQSQTRFSVSRSRRRPLYTSRTTSIPSSTQKLLKPPPSVCPIALGSSFKD